MISTPPHQRVLGSTSSSVYLPIADSEEPKIASTEIPIRFGADVESELGVIEGIQLQQEPEQFRFALWRGQPFLFAFVPDGENELRIGSSRAGYADEWLDTVDFLIRSNRIIETRMHEPEKAFEDETSTVPSIHLTISYGEDRWWTTWYLLDDVPSNIRSLLEGCHSMGIKLLGPPPWKTLTQPEITERYGEE